MKTLNPPTGDSTTLWTNIVNKKNLDSRKKLLAKKTLIEGRYRFYQSHAAKLDAMCSLDWSKEEEIKELLISCFGNNVSFTDAKKALFSNVTKCPYCTINRPNTLDHYFDKADYPEFSVFLPNLIPCCSECNTAKGTKIFDTVKTRKYIHFYFDPIPSYQFLFVNFTFDSNSAIPKININLDFQEVTPDTSRIEKHFMELNLFQKIKDSISDKLPTVIAEISLYKGKPHSEVRNVLNLRYDSLVRTKGLNYWETCMFSGILNSSDFIVKYVDFAVQDAVKP